MAGTVSWTIRQSLNPSLAPGTGAWRKVAPETEGRSAAPVKVLVDEPGRSVLLGEHGRPQHLHRCSGQRRLANLLLVTKQKPCHWGPWRRWGAPSSLRAL